MSLFKNKMHIGMILMTICFLVMGLAFNNCTKVGVSDLGETSDVKLTGDFGDPEALIATCQNARSLGKLRVAKFQRSFEDTQQQCEWEKNENLSIQDGTVRARKDQLESFEVANGSSTKATICNILMKSNEVPNFYYDDNVIMTLNGYILASTTDFTRHFESKNGLYKYSWNHLVGKPAQFDPLDSTPDKQYCAGADQKLSHCLFPQTERTGKAEIEIGETVIQTILAMTSSKKIDLGLVTTGDNDPKSDCRHVPIDLTIDVEYIVE